MIFLKLNCINNKHTDFWVINFMETKTHNLFNLKKKLLVIIQIFKSMMNHILVNNARKCFISLLNKKLIFRTFRRNDTVFEQMLTCYLK